MGGTGVPGIVYAADLGLTWSCCTPDTWQEVCLIGGKRYTGSRCSSLKTDMVLLHPRCLARGLSDWWEEVYRFQMQQT